MKAKDMQFLLIFNFIYRFGSGEALITVNGTINGSVILPTRSPYTNLSEVQWTIVNRVIAFYFEPDVLELDSEKFGDRLRLNKTDGSLEIRQLQMADAGTYAVEVSNKESKHSFKVKLMIYERADVPVLEVLTSVSEPGFCNVSVRCATLQGLWVVSHCELTQRRLMCQETARNDSTVSALLLITTTKDAINCSSSNPASTSSAPLLPVAQVCQVYVPDPDDGHTQRTRNGIVGTTVLIIPSALLLIIYKIYKPNGSRADPNGRQMTEPNIEALQSKDPKTDPNDLQTREPETDPNDLLTRESETDPKDLQTREPKTDLNDHQTREPKTDPNDLKTREPKTDPNDLQTREPETDHKDLQTREPKADPNDHQMREPKTDPNDLLTRESETDPKDLQTREPKTDLNDLQTREPETDPKDLQTREPKADPNDCQMRESKTDPNDLKTREPKTDPDDLQTREPKTDQLSQEGQKHNSSE